jgi:hypothetical protein
MPIQGAVNEGNPRVRQDTLENAKPARPDRYVPEHNCSQKAPRAARINFRKFLCDGGVWQGRGGGSAPVGWAELSYGDAQL